MRVSILVTTPGSSRNKSPRLTWDPHSGHFGAVLISWGRLSLWIQTVSEKVLNPYPKNHASILPQKVLGSIGYSKTSQCLMAPHSMEIPFPEKSRCDPRSRRPHPRWKKPPPTRASTHLVVEAKPRLRPIKRHV